MNLHEYQSKQLLENFDLPTAKSVVAFSEEEISSLISELDGEEFVEILSKFTKIPEKERTPQLLS